MSVNIADLQGWENYRYNDAPYIIKDITLLNGTKGCLAVSYYGITVYHKPFDFVRLHAEEESFSLHVEDESEIKDLEGIVSEPDVLESILILKGLGSL